MKTIIAASIMLFTAGLIAPVSGYHIDPTPVGGGLAVSDWVYNGGLLTICESNGLMDDRTASPVPRSGNGGLCSTGRNDATGTQGHATPPAVDDWTRLDLCDALTLTRVGNTCASGPSMSASSTGSNGRTDAHGYLARVGIYECFIPTHRSGLLVNTDYALYYQELYAFWSMTGNGLYTGTDTPGMLHDGDGPNPPGTRNIVSAHQGHVTVFPDLTASEPGASPVGSVETTATGVPAGVTLTDDSALSPYGLDNSCGSSPACPPSTPTCTTATGGPHGPVVRAPYSGVVGDHPVPACAQTWDGFVVLTFDCLDPQTCSMPLVAVATSGVSFDTTVPFGTGDVIGQLTCSTTSVTSAAPNTADVQEVPAPGTTGIGVGAGVTTGTPAGTNARCERVGGTFGNLITNVWAVVCQPDP